MQQTEAEKYSQRPTEQSVAHVMYSENMYLLIYLVCQCIFTH